MTGDTRSGVEVTLVHLQAATAHLAELLLDLDTRVTRVQLDPAALTGETASRAGLVRDRLGWLWDRYHVLSDVVSRAGALRGDRPRLNARRVVELEALLHRAWVPRMPPPPGPGSTPASASASGSGSASAPGSGSASGRAGGPGEPESGGGTPAAGGMLGTLVHPEDLLDGTAETVEAVRADLDAIEAAWATHLDALAATEQQFAELTATARRIGVEDLGELVAARAAMSAVAAAVVADPLSVTAADLADAAEEATRAATVLAALARAHDALDAELAAAEALLDEIVAVARDGERSARTVVERVTGTSDGLLRLDEGWFDAPRRGLRPWLDRLAAAGTAGEWQRAARGLMAWQRFAEATLASARRVAEANAAPLNRRSELRGLLGALRAKAGRMGLSETPDVDALFVRARDALYTSPTDLDAADKLVRSFAQLIANRVEGTGAPGGSAEAAAEVGVVGRPRDRGAGRSRPLGSGDSEEGAG